MIKATSHSAIFCACLCEIKDANDVSPVEDGKHGGSVVISLNFAHLRTFFFLRSAAHAAVIQENGDLQTNARNSRTIWSILIL